MPKATLEFNLDDPDEGKAHLRCIKALDLSLAILDIQGYLRDIEKYGVRENKKLVPEYRTVEKTIETIRNKISEIIREDRNLDLDELTD